MVTIEPSTIHVFDMTVENSTIDSGTKVEVVMEDVLPSYDGADTDVIYLRYIFYIETTVPAGGFEIDVYMERTYKLYPKNEMTARDLHSCAIDGSNKIREMLDTLYSGQGKAPTVVLETFEEDFFPGMLAEITEKDR